MSTSDLGEIPLGERVTVRHRLPDGRATDAVGTLSARDSSSVTLQTRRGVVRVLLASVVVHRQVRPTPWRIATFLRGAGVAVLGREGVLLGDDEDGGAPPATTLALLDELVEAGIPVFVLADGRGRGPEELERVGLGHLVPSLVPVDLRGGEPRMAYAVAHAGIEQRLGRQVARSQVRLTDDRADRVAAAREAGWQARVFTHPA